jgi:anti-anti-sigma regulatory factor
MTASDVEGANSGEIRLQGVVNIASAGELHARLVESLASGGNLHIRVEDAVELDVTILQLILAAERDWRQAGKSFALRGPFQQQVSAAIADAGFLTLHAQEPAELLEQV